MAILPKRKLTPITARKKAVPKKESPAVSSKANKAIDPEAILELINRRQRQVIVHAVIYYRFDDNIIDDHTYTKWAFELADLMKKYPELAKKSEFWKDMKDFVGHTGFNLATNPWGIAKAQYLLKLRDKYKQEGRVFTC